MIDKCKEPLKVSRCVILLDNGSLRAETTRRLRQIAARLSDKIGEIVYPVSARHSNKVSVSALEGVAADVWPSFVERKVDQGVCSFVVIPLFFGMSGALVDYIPKTFQSFADKRKGLSLVVARPLVDLENPNDCGVADLMLGLLRQRFTELGKGRVSIVLMIDHGSPLQEVARCRDLVAKQMSQRLESEGIALVACSMERRPGDAYAFSDPLLADLLESDELASEGEVVLSRMFLFPGRHAEPGGDIDSIIEASGWAKRGGVVHFCDLVGESPALIEMLEARCRTVL